MFSVFEIMIESLADHPFVLCLGIAFVVVFMLHGGGTLSALPGLESLELHAPHIAYGGTGFGSF